MARRSQRTACRDPDGFETRMCKALRNNRIRELRPKNCGVVKVRCFSGLARALAGSASVEALYLQAQPLLDDAGLRAVTEALMTNPSITGVNLGELPAVSAQGWADFVAAVPRTGIVDCYAQPAGGGPSEAECQRLKAAVMANRRRLNVPRGRHPSMWRTTDYAPL